MERPDLAAKKEELIQQ